MKFNFEFVTVIKLGDWAANLDDDIDFIDYWFHLSLSQTKYKIESDIMNNINAFHWNRWKEDFEIFVDGYAIVKGEGYSAPEREWFAMYVQYLVYAFQVSSRFLAEYYGKPVFRDIMKDWFKYHTFGVDQFVERIIIKHGLPAGVSSVEKLCM
jgi:hypothetical protein